MDDAIIYFKKKFDPEPPIAVYRHYDGEPKELLEDLDTFFNTMKLQCFRPRFDDPENVATKYVVWQAPKYSRDPQAMPLEFGGVFITRPLKGLDFEHHPDHTYTVTCPKDPDEFPDVKLISKRTATG